MTTSNAAGNELLAYQVHCGDPYECSLVVFAKTRNAARMSGRLDLDSDYIETRARRVPSFDPFADTGKIPDKVLRDAGWHEDDTHCDCCSLAYFESLPESYLCGECERCTECGCECNAAESADLP